MEIPLQHDHSQFYIYLFFDVIPFYFSHSKFAMMKSPKAHWTLAFQQNDVN